MSMLTPRGFEIRGNSRRPALLRRRRRLRVLALVAAVALVGAGWLAYDRWLADPAPDPMWTYGPYRAATQAPSPAAACTAPVPRTITVSVSNSTAKPGLATAVGAALRSRGFRVATIGNAAGGPPVTVAAEVRAAKVRTAQARAVAAWFDGARVVTDERSGQRVDVVLGAAYSHLRKTPAPAC